MGAGTSIISMPPSIRRLALLASASKETCQKSGSSFAATSVMAVWLAGEIFFQVSRLMVTSCEAQA